MQAIQATGEDGRELRRAGELIGAAVDVLRDELAAEGALGRSVDRLARVSRGLDTGGEAALAPTRHALADVLAIGSAARDALGERASQCLESLATVERLLSSSGARASAAAPARPSDGPRGVERRAAPRVALEVEVGFETDNNFYTGFSEDVSEGGLFVATYRLLPIGTKLDLEITLPTGQLVRTRAEVRWLRDPRDEDPDVRPGMGLRFESLLAEDACAVAELVRLRAPLFYEE